MEAQGQADKAQVKAADFHPKAHDSGAPKDPPAQSLLTVVLLVIGVFAFLPMILPMLTRHQVHGSSPMVGRAAPDEALIRSSLGRDMLYMQAHEKANHGHYGLAIEELTKVINASSMRVDAYYNRGKCYMNLPEPRFDLALSDFNRALALDPHDGDLYSLRATVYEHLGNRALAATDRKMADKYTWHDPK
jgi:tetratricopeptide (TPR) repeat protein